MSDTLSGPRVVSAEDQLIEDAKALLTATSDTCMGMSPEEYIPIVEAEGFELAMMHPFQYFWKTIDGDGELYNDTMYVYFQPGILLVFDTFHSGKSVNSGSCYYNWIRARDNRNILTSSGRWQHPDDNGRVPIEKWDAAAERNELIWVGHHDCREALRFHIRQLREGGTFLNPWKFSPMVSLVHWADYRERRDREQGYLAEDYSWYDQVTLERFAKLPQKVQDALVMGKS